MRSPIRNPLPLLVSALLVTQNVLPAAESLRFFTQPLIIPERGAVTSCILLLGTNRFSFLPPPDWRVQCDDNSKTVTLTSSDLGVGVHFKFITDRSQTGQPLQADIFRPRVLARFPGGIITNEFTCFTSGREGLAFDVDHVGAKKMKMTTRLAFVPFPGGLVEFDLTTTQKQFELYQLPFGNLLTSFRIEPAPK